MSSPQHLKFLDGMRAAAALVVVFHHAWLQSWPYTIYPDLRPSGMEATLTGWLAYGKLAVTAFIVVSGFCLMLPVVRYSAPVEPVRFFRRRCQRILPPYFAALAMALILDMFLRPHTGTAYDDSFPITLAGILSHCLLIQNFSGNPYQISGPLWSIAVEFQIYLFFPLFIALYRRWGIVAMLSATSILGYTASMALGKAGFDNTFAHFMVIFGLGMAAAHFAFRTREGSGNRVATICGLTLPLAGVAGILYHHRFGSDKVVTDTLMGLAVACTLLLATVSPTGILCRTLSFRPLVWIGSFSYSLYLVHFPLQQVLWQTVIVPLGLPRSVAFIIVATCGTCLILAASRGFFLLVEKPCMAESRDGRQRAVLAETAS